MPTKRNKPTFEDSVARLESLIEAMENGDTPLADLVAKFEEGSKLLKDCQAQLTEAEIKIKQHNIGNAKIEPIDELGEE
jgi:exodeoxyribonuclease VII small subunit